MADPCKQGWGSYHEGGIQFSRCDGSTIISQNIDMDVFRAMGTIADNEDDCRE